jgi:hypothetical protein
MRLRTLQIRPGGESAAAVIAGQHGTADVIVVLHGRKVLGKTFGKI